MTESNAPDAALISRTSPAAGRPETVARLLKEARRIAKAEAAAFALREAESCFYLEEDAIQPLWKGQRFPQNLCISGWSMRHRQPAIVSDALQDPRIPYNIYRSTFVKSLVMTPVGKPEPVGALGVYWSEARRPEPELIDALDKLTAELAEELHQAKPRTPTFSGKPFPVNRHVCGFFRGPSEQYTMMLPFIREGLERGEKAVHVVKEDAQQAHLARLQESGIDVERLLRSGQLELLGWEQTYLSRGRFEMNRMPELIEALIAKSRADGFPMLRYVGNMEWSLEDCPGVGDVMEYEARLHPLLLKYPDPIVCCYNIGRFASEFVVDMLRVHETAIVCGILNQNPYFVPPDKYVAERRMH